MQFDEAAGAEDMQFDEAQSTFRPWETTHERIEESFRAAGYGDHIPTWLGCPKVND